MAWFVYASKGDKIVTNDILLKKVKFLVMLILGIVMVIKPNSLLIILLFILGAYLIVLGFNAFISCITLLKFKKGWLYDGIKALVLLVVGILFLFNTPEIAVALSGILFVILGLFIIFIGIMAIVRAKENSTGILFIIIGLLIALFPLGVSALITRIIGASLIGLSVYLLVSLKNTKSS